MSYIVGLRLTNFLRYRGSTELELEPKAYALVAEWEGAPDRSNWGGKSSLVWAIRFALSGQHPRRTEDDWITDGESQGGVDVEISDGTFISRTRARGKSTQLRVIYQTPDGTEAEAHGSDAQEVLDRILGFDDRDAVATWWVGQGAMARLLTMQSAPLTEIVSAWLDLDPLDDAAAFIAKRLKELGDEDQRCVGSLSALVSARESLPSCDEAMSARDTLARIEESIGRKLKLVDADDAIAQWKRWESNRAAHDRLIAAESELATVVVRAPVAPSADAIRKAEAGLAAAQSSLGILQSDVSTKRSLVRGEFDGNCPVGGIACPVRRELNNASAEAKALHTLAIARQSECAELVRVAGTQLRTLRDQAQVVVRHDATVLELERQIAQDRVGSNAYLAAGAPPDLDTVQKLRDDLTRTTVAKEAAARVVMDITRFDGEVAKAKAKRVELGRQITARREASLILGRQGAARRIAESALHDVEHAANAALARCGIDLQIGIQWSRESKQLAKACYTCGAAFGTSQRTKTCGECGSQRGFHRDEKLSIECSSESGGALDIAGAMVQLAAAQWLRRRRGYAWGTVVLDEPLGQLDRYNRSAVATKLAGALRSDFGAEQAFVIAHDTATLDAMPGRIRVVAGPTGSRAEVLS